MPDLINDLVGNETLGSGASGQVIPQTSLNGLKNSGRVDFTQSHNIQDDLADVWSTREEAITVKRINSPSSVSYTSEPTIQTITVYGMLYRGSRSDRSYSVGNAKVQKGSYYLITHENILTSDRITIRGNRYEVLSVETVPSKNDNLLYRVNLSSIE